MASLPPNDRRKLVGVLGMLGSDAAGERAAAALLATRMIKAAGLQWDDLIGGTPLQHLHSISPQPSSENSGDLSLCLRHLDELTDWEFGFCQSLCGRHRRSTAQNLATSKLVAGATGAADGMTLAGAYSLPAVGGLPGVAVRLGLGKLSSRGEALVQQELRSRLLNPLSGQRPPAPANALAGAPPGGPVYYNMAP